MSEFEFLAYLMKATKEAEKKRRKKISVPDGDGGFIVYDRDNVVNALKKAVREGQKPSERPEKIDIKLTFIGGGEIVIPDEQWDDYSYDGKFFTINKAGADIMMYNAKQVYSLVLVRQGDE